MKRSRFLRSAMVMLSGGMLVQVAGCGTILAPIGIGLAENFLLSFVLGGALGG